MFKCVRQSGRLRGRAERQRGVVETSECLLRQSAGTIPRKRANVLDSGISKKPEMQMIEQNISFLKENYPQDVAHLV